MGDRGLTRLEVAKLVVLRGDQPVVQALSLSIAGGGWTALVGANGCGKTTLLRAIAGRLPVAGGAILIDGIDLAGRREVLARSIGFAVSGETLPEALSPAELFSAVTWKQPRPADAIDAAPIFEALALDAYLDHQIGILSAGIRQRVALHCAFLLSPGIVVLDEPFNWLDPTVAYDLKVALSAATRRGLTLLTALHDTGSTIAYCDRLIMMNAGILVYDVAGEALRQASSAPAEFEAALVARLRKPIG